MGVIRFPCSSNNKPASSNVTLASGQSSVLLYFPGYEIHEAATSSPYTVHALTISGEGQSLAVEGEIALSGTYFHSDFERAGPSAPTGITVMDTSCLDGALRVSWTASQDPEATAYRVYHGYQPGVYDFRKDVGNSLEADIEGLVIGATYYISVVALNSVQTQGEFATQVIHTIDTPVDTDADGYPDACDNCSVIANTDQRDSNGDGFGNYCDGDLNNDGSTNTLDLNLYKQAHRARLGDANYNADADFNGDDVINTLDLNIYKGLHRKPPGPSCCGFTP